MKAFLEHKRTKPFMCIRCGKTLDEKIYTLVPKLYGTRKLWRICDTCFRKRNSIKANEFYHRNKYNGKYPKPKDSSCELCGTPNLKYPYYHYHHWDDSDRTKGIWVCNICHHVLTCIEHKGFEVVQNILTKYMQRKLLLENSEKWLNKTLEFDAISKCGSCHNRVNCEVRTISLFESQPEPIIECNQFEFNLLEG